MNDLQVFCHRANRRGCAPGAGSIEGGLAAALNDWRLPSLAHTIHTHHSLAHTL